MAHPGEAEVGLDEAVIARKALLYSDAVVIRDPAELLRPWGRDAQDAKLSGHEHWPELWRSAVWQLGVVHKLVRTGIVSFYPAATISSQASYDRSNRFAQRERQQEAELRALYRTDEWASVLRDL